MVSITINIKKNYLFVLIVVLMVGFTLAYGGTNPPVMGHSFGELEIIPNLSDKGVPVMKSFTVETNKDKYGSIQETLAESRFGYSRNAGGFYDLAGCKQAINSYCGSKGYSIGVTNSYSCGGSVANNQPCPAIDGCFLNIHCLKTIS